MATGKIEKKVVSPSFEFDVDSIPIPPGTKSRARLPRGAEPDPLPARAWWIIGATAVAMLLVGIVMGKFVL